VWAAAVVVDPPLGQQVAGTSDLHGLLPAGPGALGNSLDSTLTSKRYRQGLTVSVAGPNAAIHANLNYFVNWTAAVRRFMENTGAAKLLIGPSSDNSFDLRFPKVEENRRRYEIYSCRPNHRRHGTIISNVRSVSAQLG
jgi:hypothetical protein